MYSLKTKQIPFILFFIILLIFFTLTACSNGNTEKYQFGDTQWGASAEQTLEDLGLTEADVSEDKPHQSEFTKDMKDVFGYLAKDYQWQDINGDLYLAFKDDKLIAVQFTADSEDYDKLSEALTALYGEASGETSWGSSDGYGIELYEYDDIALADFHAEK